MIDLRRRLGIDPAYLSRIIGRFKADGLVTTGPSTTDARRRVLRLTDRGVAVFGTLDQRSAAENRALLARLTEADQDRLIEALDTAQEIIAAAAAAPDYTIRGPRAGHLPW